MSTLFAASAISVLCALALPPLFGLLGWRRDA
jgi:hypothetical protein